MRLIDADSIPWTDLNDNPNSKIRVLVTFAEKVNRMPTIAQPDKDMIHLQREQAYMQGWEDGRKALREEIWEDGRDRLD